MSTQTDTLLKLLEKLDLSFDEIKVYLFLLANKQTSALEISRRAHLSRTKVYRILDTLYDRNLINHTLEDRGLRFGANDYHQVEMLVAEKEVEVKSLKRSLPLMLEELQKLAVLSPHQDSQVFYYTGIQGLKQVTMNSLHANGKLYIYEHQQDMSAFLDKNFSEWVRRELVKEKIKTYQLTNFKKIKKFTKVKKNVTEFWEVKYLNPQEVPIEFEVMIYNNIYCMYSFMHNDVFCVEIHNPHLAKMQKQLFEFIWKRAVPMKKLDAYGTAVVE